MNGKTLAVAFTLALAFVTYDEVHNQSHLPPYPQRYMFVGLTYGLLGVLATVAAPVATVLGWGLLLAFAYKSVGATQAASDVTNAATSSAVTAPAGAAVVAL